MDSTALEATRQKDTPTANAHRDLVLVIVFALLIGSPLAVMLLSRGKTSHAEEMRELAEPPALSLEAKDLFSFPGRFREYFADHFGLRSELIRAHSIFTVGYLKISESPKVVLGLDGWLFLTESIEWHRDTPLSAAELERWREVLEARRDWLRERGSRYLFVIVPDKCSVYPEYLPESFRSAARYSKARQCVEYMRAHSDVDIIDARGCLLGGKANGLLYFKTDTHFTALGAYKVYERVMEGLVKWFPGVAAVAQDRFEVVERQGTGGDLARLMNVRGWMTEREIALLPREAPTARPSGTVVRGSVVTTEKGAIPRAVILHDSFGPGLEPFLSEHFQRAVFSWGAATLNTTLVESERPDVVIHEIVERAFTRAPLLDAAMEAYMKRRAGR